MKKWLIKSVFSIMVGIVAVIGLPIFANGGTSVSNNFSASIDRATYSIKDKLDAAPTDANMKSGAAIWLIEKVSRVVFPVLVVVAVAIAMFGLYTLLSDPAKIKEGMSMILYGIIGIIVLFSAKYLSSVIFTTLWSGGQIADKTPTVGGLISNIYTMMIYPFLKMAIYFSLGILVLVMMSRVFAYITSQDDKVKSKAMGVITWSVLGMLMITGAKQIVEAIYGKQEKVLSTGVENLSGIGTQILNPKSIPILFQILNWALGLVSLVLLILIVFQTYKMLTKPDDESTFKSLKTTIAYAFAGLLLIGVAYLLANLFVIT